MSEENVELVRRGTENTQEFWAMLDEYVVWDLRDRPILDLEHIYFGREAVIEASRYYWVTWDGYALEAEEFIDVGSSVVVVVHERARGKGSGAPIDERWAQVWTFSRRRIVRWECFATRAAAIEAVGVRE